jgi:hypothetical protein
MGFEFVLMIFLSAPKAKQIFKHLVRHSHAHGA